MYQQCELCPRRCGVNRLAGQLGYCRMGSEMVAARGALHHWEEPVISGTRGSGAIFFSGCTLGCIFCQNQEISKYNYGKAITAAELRMVMERLIDQGAHNINLVTPTHFIPSILPALYPKLPVPVVYNCGGYERVETLKQLEGLVDVYLPDMKYGDTSLGKKLSCVEDYPEVAKNAIVEMVRQCGKPVIQDGILQSGVLVRHLVLPGAVDNSLETVEWLKETFPSGEILVSLMAQYTPYGKAKSMPPFDRKITEAEYEGVLSWADMIGLDITFTQSVESSEEMYIPSFQLEGL